MMIPGDHAAERLSAEIQRLSAPSLADRDAVMAELSALDWSIARHLRPLAREAPPAVRDRTLFTLECAAQTAQTRILLAEPAVTLRVAGPTWHPAAERALGLSLEPADELRTRAVDLDIHTPHPLHALDYLAQAVGGRWRRTRGGTILLTRPVEPPYPAAYAHAVRGRVLALHVDRHTDFVRPALDVRLRVEIVTTFPLALLCAPNPQVIGAWNDDDVGTSGSATEVAATDEISTNIAMPSRYGERQSSRSPSSTPEAAPRVAARSSPPTIAMHARSERRWHSTAISSTSPAASITHARGRLAASSATVEATMAPSVPPSATKPNRRLPCWVVKKSTACTQTSATPQTTNAVTHE